MFVMKKISKFPTVLHRITFPYALYDGEPIVTKSYLFCSVSSAFETSDLCFGAFLITYYYNTKVNTLKLQRCSLKVGNALEMLVGRGLLEHYHFVTFWNMEENIWIFWNMEEKHAGTGIIPGQASNTLFSWMRESE